jgi:hypothetical protein
MERSGSLPRDSVRRGGSFSIRQPPEPDGWDAAAAAAGAAPDETLPLLAP